MTHHDASFDAVLRSSHDWNGLSCQQGDKLQQRFDETPRGIAAILFYSYLLFLTVSMKHTRVGLPELQLKALPSQRSRGKTLLTQTQLIFGFNVQ